MPVRFCTLFDSRYAARGFVMLESLERYLRPNDEVVVLAIDEITRQMLAKAGRAKWRVVTAADLGDPGLDAAEQTRPRREFCWTCTPALSAWMVRNCKDGDTVVYLDADLLFFDDPRVLLDELSGGGSVLIHEHRFSQDRIHYESSSGRFNVGFVAFAFGAEARECAEHWRSQTIECCVLDPDNGLCGDQGYLNAWPQLYSNVRIMKHIGGGVAPWNVSQYQIGRNGKGPTIDGRELVFYHYHSLRTLSDSTFGFVAVQPAFGYEFTLPALKEIYRPYVKRIGKVTRHIARMGFPIEPDRVVERKELLYGLLRQHYLHPF